MRQEGHPACKNWMLVCWWQWFDWSFAWLNSSPVVATTSIILCFNKHRLTQAANPGSLGKWPLKRRERERGERVRAFSTHWIPLIIQIPFQHLLLSNPSSSVLWHCWLCDRKGIQPVKILHGTDHFSSQLSLEPSPTSSYSCTWIMLFPFLTPDQFFRCILIVLFFCK